MSQRLSAGAACLVLFYLSAAGAGEDKIPSSDLFPTKVGTAWRYHTSGGKIHVRVTRHEKVGGVTCAVLETRADEQVVATEQVAVRADGVYRYLIAGQKADPPFRFLKLPANNGDTWEAMTRLGGQTIKATFEIGEEEVKVPAGKFQAVVVRSREFEVAGQKLSSQVWYARGVGMVKSEMTIAGNPIHVELEKFEPAK